MILLNRKATIALLFVIIWMGVIFIYSDMESSESNNKSKSIVNETVEKIDIITKASSKTIKRHQSIAFIENSNYIFRKICHACIYLALSILVFHFLICFRKMKLYKYYILCFIICFLYACSDEYHQTFVVGRTGQFSDVLIDSVGALLGSGLSSVIYVFFRKKRRKKKKCIN